MQWGVHLTDYSGLRALAELNNVLRALLTGQHHREVQEYWQVLLGSSGHIWRSFVSVHQWQDCVGSSRLDYWEDGEREVTAELKNESRNAMDSLSGRDTRDENVRKTCIATVCSVMIFINLFSFCSFACSLSCRVPTRKLFQHLSILGILYQFSVLIILFFFSPLNVKH